MFRVYELFIPANQIKVIKYIVTECKTINLYYYFLKRKCDIYWPEAAREPVYYGDLVVELESESTLPDYVLRVMSIKLVSAL